MIKLKEIIKDIFKELNLTPKDLKKFNKIIKNKIKIKNSIHSDDEPDYGKEGFGPGGASSFIYGVRSPDRPYISRKKSIGYTKIPVRP